jgi:hypothetical protein
MTESDFDEFTGLVSSVMAFYRQDVSEFAFSVWWEACKGYDLDGVRRAFNAHAVDADAGMFAPKPADVARQLQGRVLDRALMAWSRVHAATQRIGAYVSVDFGDPIIHAAIVDLGGWPALCRLPIDALPFTQKRFCDAFRAHTGLGAADAPRYLSGEHETANEALGYTTAPESAGALEGPRR